MMNPEIKAKWVAALRSGEYTQGFNRLRSTNNTFCCLGVLCNMHAQAHPETAAMQKDPGRYIDHKDSAPSEVMKWAGLYERMGDNVQIGNKMQRLAYHNDDCRTFAEIADAIEEQL